MSELTASQALSHEALFPRFEALTRQVEAIAARLPGAEVPAPTRTTAEALLFDAQRFRVRRRRSAIALAPALPLPAAPESYGPLATVLGQALAELVAFEARHSEWSDVHKGFVWRITHNRLLPVQRLRPHGPTAHDPAADKNAARIRAEIVRRIAAKYDEGYDAGLRAAQGEQ